MSPFESLGVVPLPSPGEGHNKTAYEIEADRRARHLSMMGNSQLSEVLSFRLEEDSVHIKLGTSTEFIKEKGFKTFENEVLVGLKNLSWFMKANEKYKTVVATSWIVTHHPRLMESLGFAINPTYVDSDKFNFDKKKRKIRRAEMSREDFLAKYWVTYIKINSQFT